MLEALNKVPPGGKHKKDGSVITGVRKRNNLLERRAMTIDHNMYTSPTEQEEEDECEGDYPDYSLSPFVNVSPTRKQASYGYKHATIRA